MLRSIDISRAGMLRQDRYLDATAGNVTNAGTPGYKAVRAALESGEVPPPPGSELNTGTETPSLTGRIDVNRLFSQGAIKATGAPTDMAIQGDGFFVVRQQDGTPAYTRNGQFHIGADGRLADMAGRLLQPEVQLPAGAANLQIAADGTLSVTSGGSAARQPVGQLQLARFINPNGLQAQGDGLYVATPAAGAPQAVTLGPGGSQVIGGAIEAANSDIVEQLTNLMAAQRTYQLNSSAFRMADEMLHMASTMPGNG